MKITYCQDAPKRFICERDEIDPPAAGAFVELHKGRHLVRRVERAGREAIAYVVLVAGTPLPPDDATPPQLSQPA